MTLNDRVYYLAGNVPAMVFAKTALTRLGAAVADAPSPAVTHLLLPVPSFQSGGLLRGGIDLKEVLKTLPATVTVLGGNLNAAMLEGYYKIDLLQDARYLAQNAAITAHCAVKIAASHMGITWAGCPVLIVGWGRIGKCLAQLLKAMGAAVTVAARKESDRAMLAALGYGAIEYPGEDLEQYRVIFSTVPAPVISARQVALCHPDCVKIDLASSLGIDGSGVIWARGLPGIQAPESAGELIARTVLRLTEKGGA